MNQFIEWIIQPWPWYVAGPMIGLTVPALLILGNKTFGISSSLRHICAACVPAGIPPDFRTGTPGLKFEKVLDHFLFVGQDHCFS